MEECWTDFTSNPPPVPPCLSNSSPFSSFSPLLADSFYALTLFVEEWHADSANLRGGDDLELLIKKTILRLVLPPPPLPFSTLQADVSMPPEAITSALSRKLKILPHRNVPVEGFQMIAQLLDTNPQQVSHRPSIATLTSLP
jgi:hypothetical protein